MESASGPGSGPSEQTGTAVDPLVGYRTDALAFETLLGAGAMGSVYRGRQLRLDRVVAIKVIAAHLASNPAYVERFNREARTLARLHNQHIVTCHDFGPLVGPDGKQLLIMVMEFVDGQSIGDASYASMPVRTALEMYRQSAEGLVAAHSLGVVHRDIKPDNIMVTRGGMAKLADFGLAKADDSIGLTITGMALGTPAYMAPEVCRGKEPTRASDVYSLGCALFHTLAGEPLYRSASSLETIQCHVSAPAPLLAERVPHLAALDALLAKALVKDQAHRIDAAAFAREIAALSAKLPPDLKTIAVGEARREQIAEMATMATDAVDAEGVPYASTASVAAERPAPSRASSSLGGGRLDENASDAGIPDAQQARSLKSIDDSSPPTAGGASPRVESAVEPRAVREIDLGIDGPTRSPAQPGKPAGTPDGGKKPFAIPDYLQVQPELPPAPPAVAGPVTYGEPVTEAALPTAPAKAVAVTPEAKASGGSVRGKAVPSANSESVDANAGAKAPSSTELPKGGLRHSVAAAVPDAIHGAAEQLRIAEAKAHEARGDAHAAAGRWREAIAAYESGAKAVPSDVARRQLLGKAATVRTSHGRKIALVSAAACAVVAIGAMGAWSWATRSTPAAPTGPAAGVPAPATAPTATGHAGIAALERMAKDPAVDWLAVRAEAERLLPSAGAEAARVQAILQEASAEAAPIEAELAAIDALAKSDPNAALARADRFRASTKRLGSLTPRLPLPGRIDVRGPDIAAVSLEVDRAAMPTSSGMVFCRRANGLTRITVTAPGYQKASLTVPPNATPGERTYAITMTDAPTWTMPCAFGDWAQAAPRGDAVVVVSAHAVLLARPSDGADVAKLEPAGLPMAPKSGFSWLPSRDMDGDTMWLSTDDGLCLTVRTAGRAFAGARVVSHGAPPALAFGERELLFHVGKRACFSVERTEKAFALIARSDDQQLWTFALSGKLEPWMSVEDESVTVIDEGSLCMLDQEGQLLQSLPLAAIRNGPVTSIAGGACLVVPTSSGSRVLRKDGKGRYQEHPTSLSARNSQFATQGAALLIGSAGSLELMRWTGGGFAPAWSASLAKGRSCTDLSLNGDWACCCDDALAISVFDATSGKLVRAFQLAEPPITPPVVVSGAVVVVGAKGLSGYALGSK